MREEMTVHTSYTVTVSDFRRASYFGLFLRHRRPLQILFVVTAGCILYAAGGLLGFGTVNPLVFFLGGAYLIWGLFLHTIMDKAAELASSLMYLEEFGHKVAYFSLTNLSGAVISIVVGVLLYVFFIRKVLMEKTETGSKRYVDKWYSWMDMENVIYRPVLLGFLPFVCRLVCRIFDSLPDMLVVLLRKTMYRDSSLPYELPEGTGFTVLAGHMLNGFQRLGNLLWNRHDPKHKDYVHVLAMKREEIKESNMIIQRSLSFGLMLAGIGLCLTLIYIIWW